MNISVNMVNNQHPSGIQQQHQQQQGTSTEYAVTLTSTRKTRDQSTSMELPQDNLHYIEEVSGMVFDRFDLEHVARTGGEESPMI